MTTTHTIDALLADYENTPATETAAAARTKDLWDEMVPESADEDGFAELAEELAEEEAGTKAAAEAELARRAHNKRVKKTGEGERIEPASDWAFKAGSAELKALLD